MTFLLDTNAFSDFMANRPGFQARLSALNAGDRIVTCVIVRGEILFGIERLSAGKKRRALAERAERAFKAVPAEQVPVDAASYYSIIKVIRQRQGLPLDENDIWIAATARAIGATLVSRDSDFRRIEGLVVEDWTR